MKIHTIHINSEEERQIHCLKKALGFSSKKAVIMAGIRELQKKLHEISRRKRLQIASKRIRKESQKSNQEWASLSTVLFS
ncbi:MAG TPA: hypothetical protein DF383_01905 [Deltaproteobacteria bacterium]|nr:hypothetical protein [Deltaproteobacteria bacterium]